MGPVPPHRENASPARRHLKAGLAPAPLLPPQGQGWCSFAPFSPSFTRYQVRKAVHAFLNPDLGATRSQESDWPWILWWKWVWQCLPSSERRTGDFCLSILSLSGATRERNPHNRSPRFRAAMVLFSCTASNPWLPPARGGGDRWCWRKHRSRVPWIFAWGPFPEAGVRGGNIKL